MFPSDLKNILIAPKMSYLGVLMFFLLLFKKLKILKSYALYVLVIVISLGIFGENFCGIPFYLIFI